MPIIILMATTQGYWSSTTQTLVSRSNALKKTSACQGALENNTRGNGKQRHSFNVFSIGAVHIVGFLIHGFVLIHGMFNT